MNGISPQVESIRSRFERASGLVGIDSEIKERADGEFLIMFVANPTDRLFRILNESRDRSVDPEKDRIFAILKQKRQTNLLKSPEGKLFLRILAESLNVDRQSFKEDFLSRYIKSVFGAEEQIVATANHAVFGRRGAGKSTLLLYAMHSREQQNRASVWIDMQAYRKRNDDGVFADVLLELLEQCDRFITEKQDRVWLTESLQELKKQDKAEEEHVRMLLPDLKRLFSSHATMDRDLFIFLDDFHVLEQDLQPRLLSILYGIARGNRVYLKLSAIDTLTRLWDPDDREGLEPGHDIQEIRLDYNLTKPERAREHIEAILDAHAEYSGLPSVLALCLNRDVLSRLVWVSAGVPRDALHIFSGAMTNAALDSRTTITTKNINVATSLEVTRKQRDIEVDASASANELRQLLDEVKNFCLKEQKRNAFLVEVRNDSPTFQRIRRLVDLRLLHVINEGITPKEAGRKYLALILDYGFYVGGARVSRSVRLFNKEMEKVDTKDFRKLPRFKVA